MPNPLKKNMGVGTHGSIRKIKRVGSGRYWWYYAWSVKGRQCQWFWQRKKDNKSHLFSNSKENQSFLALPMPFCHLVSPYSLCFSLFPFSFNAFWRSFCPFVKKKGRKWKGCLKANTYTFFFNSTIRYFSLYLTCFLAIFLFLECFININIFLIYFFVIIYIVLIFIQIFNLTLHNSIPFIISP